MFDLIKFISQNMYIVAVALYVLGMYIKEIPKIPNFLIPFILLIIGVIFGVLIVGGTTGVLQGILCTGAAVLSNQLIKQGKEAFKFIEKDDDNE